MSKFVVVQDMADPKHTIYPQVHYIYAQDNFSPALDVAEQEKDDVSILVDLNANGTVVNCTSLSPNWQVLSFSLEQQTLANLESQLLLINCTQAKQQTDIPDLDGSFSHDAARSVLTDLERRNDELRKLIKQYDA